MKKNTLKFRYHPEKALGILYVCLASVTFGALPSLQTLILRTGVSPISLIGLVYCIVAILALTISVSRKKSLALTRSQLLQLTIMGAGGMGATSLLMYTAYTLIPSGTAMMLHFLFPTNVCIFMAIVYREQFTWRKGLAIIGSICGLACISLSGDSVSGKGIILAACSSLTYAGYFIMNEKGCVHDLPQSVKLLYISIAIATIYLMCAMAANATFPTTGGHYLLIIADGIAYYFALFCIQTGVQKLGATSASFINILEPVTSVLLSALLFPTRLGINTVLGSVLILCSIIFASIG